MNIKFFAFAATIGASLLFAGCQKEEEATYGAPVSVQAGQKVGTATITGDNMREASKVVSRIPKLRYYDPYRHRFLDLDLQNRDYVFSDPDEGFTFDNIGDNNEVMVYSDNSGDYIIYSTGVASAGNGGGGLVVAGETVLNMDFTACIGAQEIQDGSSWDDLFDIGADFDEFGLVVGIAGDFDALQDADWEAENFDPFEFIEGYASYYVISSDLSGEHEVFDWLGWMDDEFTDIDDFASSVVIDLQQEAIYLSTSGTVTVAGGSMTYDGEYASLMDVFTSFFDDSEEDVDIDIVSGYGQMACN